MADQSRRHRVHVQRAKPSPSASAHGRPGPWVMTMRDFGAGFKRAIKVGTTRTFTSPGAGREATNVERKIR